MPSTPAPPAFGTVKLGFTLIELMVIVAVIGILAAVALPSFLDSVRKGRRSEAVAALAQVQQAQERWRANNGSYAENDKLSVAPADGGLGISATTATALYELALSQVSASGYTVTATAKSGTSQANDATCSTMRVRLRGGNIQYGGCGSACALPDADVALSDPNRCWSR